MMSSAKCLCVMYHYVRDRRDGFEAGIRGLGVSAFADQLDALSAVMTPIDWPAFAAWRAGRGTIPPASFLLTFDDALSDHADVVLPILESRGLRGVFFVQTGVLSAPVMAAAHQIHLLMCRLGDAGLCEAVRRWLAVHAAEHAARVDASADAEDARRLYHYETPERARLKYLLSRALPMDVRGRLLDALFAEHVGDAAETAARWYLRWDQLARMQRLGHTIGGHGHRHLPYDLLSPDERRRDLLRCAQALGDGLGADRRPFSYPYGCCDDAIARSCANAGFVNGFTTRERWVDASDGDFHLGRVDTIHVQAFLEREFQCSQV